jgi:hypothetical protein
LDEDLLTLLDHVLDGRRLRAATPATILRGLVIIAVVVVRLLRLVLRIYQVRRVEERALLGADVDEGGLNAGEYRLDFSDVDVADRPTGIGSVDQQLN